MCTRERECVYKDRLLFPLCFFFFVLHVVIIWMKTLELNQNYTHNMQVTCILLLFSTFQTKLNVLLRAFVCLSDSIYTFLEIKTRFCQSRQLLHLISWEFSLKTLKSLEKKLFLIDFMSFPGCLAKFCTERKINIQKPAISRLGTWTLSQHEWSKLKSSKVKLLQKNEFSPLKKIPNHTWMHDFGRSKPAIESKDAFSLKIKPLFRDIW